MMEQVAELYRVGEVLMRPDLCSPVIVTEVRHAAEVRSLI